MAGLETLTGKVRRDEEEGSAKKGEADAQGPLGLDLGHDACSYCGALDLCRASNGGGVRAFTNTAAVGGLVRIFRLRHLKAGSQPGTKCTFAGEAAVCFEGTPMCTGSTCY